MQTNIPSNQANIEQVRPAPGKQYTKYHIEWITLIQGIRTTIYEMAFLIANFAQVSFKLNSDVNWTIKLSQKTNKGKCEAKRHNVMPKMQQARQNRQNRECLLKGYELRTDCLKKTTSVSSWDLELVTPTKYPNQKYV